MSHLLTHGCSPLSLTRRNLAALDIVTASTTLPGREDVALLLEEAMREHGWTGGRMEERRRSTEKRLLRIGKQKDIQDDLNKSLSIDPRWWGDPDDAIRLELLDEEEEENLGDTDLLVGRMIFQNYELLTGVHSRRHPQITLQCSSFPLIHFLIYSRPS